MELLHNLREVTLVRYACSLAVAWLAVWFTQRKTTQPSGLRSTFVASVLGSVTCALYGLFAMASLRSFLLDTDEANILSVAAASSHGQPLYVQPCCSELSYSLIYGPVTFLIYRASLALGAGALWGVRLAVATACLATLAAMFYACRKLANTPLALAVLAVPTSLLLQKISASLGARPEPWLVLCVALALAFALSGNRGIAPVLAGAFAGLAVGLKITTAPAALLLLLVLRRRFGWRSALLSAAIATSVSLSPFLCQAPRCGTTWHG